MTAQSARGGEPAAASDPGEHAPYIGLKNDDEREHGVRCNRLEQRAEELKPQEFRKQIDADEKTDSRQDVECPPTPDNHEELVDQECDGKDVDDHHQGAQRERDMWRQRQPVHDASDAGARVTEYLIVPEDAPPLSAWRLPPGYHSPCHPEKFAWHKTILEHQNTEKRYYSIEAMKSEFHFGLHPCATAWKADAPAVVGFRSRRRLPDPPPRQDHFGSRRREPAGCNQPRRPGRHDRSSAWQSLPCLSAGGRGNGSSLHHD